MIISCDKPETKPIVETKKVTTELDPVVLYRIDSVHYSPYAPGVWYPDNTYNIQYITLTSANKGYYHTRIGKPSKKYQIYGNDEIIDFSKSATEVKITFKKLGDYKFKILNIKGKEVWESPSYRFYVVQENRNSLKNPLVLSVDTFVTTTTRFVMTCPTHGFGECYPVYDTSFNDSKFTFYLPNYEWGIRVKKDGNFIFIRNMKLTPDSVILEYGNRQEPYYYIRKIKKNNVETWNNEYFKPMSSLKGYYRYQRFVHFPDGT